MTLKHKLILAVLAAIAIALAAHRFLGPGALKTLKVPAQAALEEPQTFALGGEQAGAASSADPLEQLDVDPDEDHQLAEQALVQLAALRIKPAAEPSPEPVKQIPPVELVQEPQPAPAQATPEPTAAPQQLSSASKSEETDTIQERRTLKKRERELIEQLNRQEQQLLGLTERLAEYERSGSSAASFETSMNKKVSDLEQRLVKAEQERESAQEELDKKKSDKSMAKLVSQLEDLEQRFNELKTRNDAQSTKLQGESRAKQDLETQVSSLQSKALEASKLRQERQDLENRFTAAERKLQQLAAEKKELSDRAAQLETQLKVLTQSNETASTQLRAEMKNLTQQLDESRKEYVSAKDETIELKKEVGEFERQLNEKNVTMNTLKTQLEMKEKEAGELSSQLEVSKRVTEKMKDLQNELLSAKNQLLIAQEQIRLLSGGKPAPAATRQPGAAVPPAASVPVQQAQPAQTQPADVMIVEVSVEKANLRSAPGKENSPVMQVPLGAQLVVEAREGDWFRVIAPNGSRAYIEKDVVSQVRGGGRLPRFRERSKPRDTANRSLDDNLKELVGDARPALKTPADDPADEERAFQELRRSFEANKSGKAE